MFINYYSPRICYAKRIGASEVERVKQEILFNITPQETRIAVVENGLVQEIFIERQKNHAQDRPVVGNLYFGFVAKVLPGLQAAFIEIGLGRTAFLHASDLLPSHTCAPDQQPDIRPKSASSQKTNISSLLSEGQKLLVQVVKEPIKTNEGSKGARVSAQISLPGRYLVSLPQADYIGISQKIHGQQCRQALLDNLQAIMADCQASGGYILRTSGENACAAELKAEIKALKKVWQRIQTNLRDAKCPSLIHQDLPLAMRVVRDLDWAQKDAGGVKVRIDCKDTYALVGDFARACLPPESVNQIEHYASARPIFAHHKVEQEIQSALCRRVPLECGGYLVIDPTEALTTIDINTGSYVGKDNFAETILKTNLQATTALARQLRLRNIGGIIIVDFIDMASAAHCEQVMQALARAVERDSNRIQINAMTSLGLVEMTRKRSGISLQQLLTEACPACAGIGIQKTPQTICYEIFREILRVANHFDAPYTAPHKAFAALLVVASQPVIDLLQADESGIADVQNLIGKEIKLTADSGGSTEQFDVVRM